MVLDLKRTSPGRIEIAEIHPKGFIVQLTDNKRSGSLQFEPTKLKRALHSRYEHLDDESSKHQEIMSGDALPSTSSQARNNTPRERLLAPAEKEHWVIIFVKMSTLEDDCADFGFILPQIHLREIVMLGYMGSPED